MPAPLPNDDPLRTAAHAPERSVTDTGDYAELVSTHASEPHTHPDGGRSNDTLAEVPGYVILSEIASGGMGRVLMARDLSLDREVAVKVLRPGADPARFVIESKITARLPHPGIPPVHQLGTLADGSPFLAMKLIRGRTLADELKAAGDGAASPRFVSIFEQIAQAVGFAHSVGIIHRDLKPANVMVGAFGEVQVMDWGLAKEMRNAERGTRNEHHAPSATVVSSSTRDAPGSEVPEPWTIPEQRQESSSDQTQPGSVMGTPAYMAPEQARGESVDQRADVFALGGILLAILTGKPPFSGKSAAEVIRKAALGELGDAQQRLTASGADPELIGLAKRCLAARAEDRPADAKSVADAVATYRASVEQRLRESEIERTRAEEKRKRARVQLAMAAALLLMLGGGGAFAWWQDVERTRLEGETQVLAERQQAREDRNSERLDTLVAQCEQWLREADAEKAALALAEVEKRKHEGGAETLAARIEQCQTDLHMLRELDRISEFAWSVVQNHGVSEQRVVAELAAAFQGFGIVPGQTPNHTAAARIHASLIQPRLLHSLDVWLDHAPSEALKELMVAADPDAYRTRVRAARVARDLRAVNAIVLEATASEQPAWFASALGSWSCIMPERRHELLQKVALDRPNDFSVLMALGGLIPTNMKAGTAQRIRWYQAAAAARPRSPAAWNNLALAFYDLGNLETAEAMFRKALQVYPDLAASLNGLGSIYEKRGELDRAEEYHKRAITADPVLAEAHHNLGGVYYRKEKTAEAIRCFREAIRLDPELTQARATLAEILAPTDPKGAIALWTEVMRTVPDRASYRFHFGVALEKAGQRTAAIEQFDEAVKLDPTHVPSLNSLGLALHKAGRSREGVPHFRAAIALEPTTHRLRFNLGLALLLSGDEAGAAAAFREELRLNPNDAKAQYSLGDCLHTMGKSTEAIPHFREAIRLDPNLMPAQFALGSIFGQQGKFAEAVPHLKEVVRIDPKFLPGHLNLGFAQAKRGDYDGAIASFRAAQKLEPNNAKVAKLLSDAIALKAKHDGTIAPPPREVKP